MSTFKTSEDVVKAFNEAGKHFSNDETYQSLKRAVDFLGPFKVWGEADYETYDKTVKKMEAFLDVKKSIPSAKL